MHKTWLVGMLVMVMVAPGGLATEGEGGGLVECELPGDGPPYDIKALVETLRECASRYGQICIWGEPWQPGSVNVISLAAYVINYVTNPSQVLPVKTYISEQTGDWVLKLGIAGPGKNCQAHSPVSSAFVWNSVDDVNESEFSEWYLSSPPGA